MSLGYTYLRATTFPDDAGFSGSEVGVWAGGVGFRWRVGLWAGGIWPGAEGCDTISGVTTGVGPSAVAGTDKGVANKFGGVEVRNCCPGIVERRPAAGSLVSAATGRAFSSEELFPFDLKQKQRMATVQYQFVFDVCFVCRESVEGVCWRSSALGLKAKMRN